MSRIALDANVLIYAIDASEPRKQRSAQRAVAHAAGRDSILALQTLAEFYFVATRKGKMGAPDAKARIDELRILFPVAFPGERTLELAIDVSERYRMGFWDAMLIAVLREAGAGVLLSEDLQDGQVYEGVRCLNPFTRTTAQLGKLLRAS